jgi:hypothetical protein
MITRDTAGIDYDGELGRDRMQLNGPSGPAGPWHGQFRKNIFISLEGIFSWPTICR